MSNRVERNANEQKVMKSPAQEGDKEYALEVRFANPVSTWKKLLDKQFIRGYRNILLCYNPVLADCCET